MLHLTSYFKFGRFRYHLGVARPHIHSLTAGQHEEVRHILHDSTAKNASLQTKLKIGQPNDPYEREADRLADQVTHQATTPINAGAGSRQPAPVGHILQKVPAGNLQAQAECSAGGCPLETDESDLQAKEQAGHTPTLTSSAAQQLHNLRGGQPLTRRQRAYFEPRFGYDFAKVRLHTGGQAARTAQSVNARAFTYGPNIAFNRGEYHEDSAGRHLLAHELTHVIQQGKAPMAPQVQCQAQSGCTAREPENCPTYEQWLHAFRNVASFISRDGALRPGAGQAGFRVLGGGAASRDPAAPAVQQPPTPVGRRFGDRFIDHPTDQWVRQNLPENLRRTAYQLPTDCADILVILRHVYLAAHRRTENYRGWVVGDTGGGAAQRRIQGVIGAATSGNLERVVNPYSDSRGNPIRDFARLEHLLHPGDQLVWDHHGNGLTRRRTGGHSQTIMDIQRDGSGRINRLELLQGNQPLSLSQVPGIVAQVNEERQQAGQRPLPAGQVAGMRQRGGPVRSAPGRRIEVDTMRRDEMVDIDLPRRRGSAQQPTRVWTWNDSEHTTLKVAGPPRAAARPRMRRLGGVTVRRISDWFTALARASLARLHGVFEAALLEVRGEIDGGQQVPASDAGRLGSSAGGRLWQLARTAVGRFTNFGRSRGDLQQGDLGHRVHFDRLHRMRAMIRALGGIQPPVYLGNPQAAASVRTTFGTIDQNFNLSARGAEEINLTRRVQRGGELVQVLVTGFDPFSTTSSGNSPQPPQAGEWNPSGSAALAMDGLTLNLGGRNRAAVEGVVMPVSFRQFDEGIVEQIIGRAGTDVDAVITVSLDPNLATSAPVRLEQFAVGVRRTDDLQPHRLFPVEHLPAAGIQAVPGGTAVDPAIIETTADVAAIALATAGRTRRGLPAVQQPNIGRAVTLRFASLPAAQQAARALGLTQAVHSRVLAIDDVRTLQAIIGSMQRVLTRQGPTADIIFRAANQQFRATVLSGPGGSFLSNEISFRAQRELRRRGSSATSFHVHTPGGSAIPQDTSSRTARQTRTRALSAARGVVNTLIATLRRMIRAVGQRVLVRRRQQQTQPQAGRSQQGGRP
jgi:pyrrolidone-carboxylate peptidase